MLISKKEIGYYIPQRDPFIMVDNLLTADEDSYESNFMILSSNYFLEADKMKPYGLIENIAQTCAAGIAWNATKASMSGGRKRMEGFLASISKFENFEDATVEDMIITKVKKKVQFQNMYSFYGECFRDNELLLKCEIKIVEVEA